MAPSAELPELWKQFKPAAEHEVTCFLGGAEAEAESSDVSGWRRPVDEEALSGVCRWFRGPVRTSLPGSSRVLTCPLKLELYVEDDGSRRGLNFRVQDLFKIFGVS